MKNFLLVFILSFSLQAYSQTSLTQAPDFTVTDVHGVTHNLFDYLDDGKHVVVDFFFTTCGPCISSVPIINDAFTMFGCNTGEVIFLSIDNGDTDAEVLQYELDYGALLPAASGNDGGGDAVNNAYGISAYPTVILIAPDRTILEQDIWPVSGLENAILSAGISQSACSSTSIVDITHNIKSTDVIFDMYGREYNVGFNKLPKGVYIINGQKVFKTE